VSENLYHQPCPASPKAGGGSAKGVEVNSWGDESCPKGYLNHVYAITYVTALCNVFGDGLTNMQSCFYCFISIRVAQLKLVLGIEEGLKVSNRRERHQEKINSGGKKLRRVPAGLFICSTLLSTPLTSPQLSQEAVYLEK
jgi:hypothetical protein